MIALVIKAAGLLGFKASPLIAGAVLAAALTLAVGTFTAWIYHKGKAACEARHLSIAVTEMHRQGSAVEQIQQTDAARAMAAAAARRKNQEAIDATPANSRACLDRDAVGRVRAVR